ncbi:hypothetical protein A8709_05660 [Paenibacillus pectinilyticus]|uniref:Uncharacterized protein n=1 Tax=Paenibacillus pectinilyticus TaxID=512399 RepID=A0A1C0ZSW1_9BACL|nr:hypothetical protein [Paenibacillus pectinilyticus]OCT11168.1 hypothetical protein A8709_05660 [Paenibacillus pectinilyticus]
MIIRTEDYMKYFIFTLLFCMIGLLIVALYVWNLNRMKKERLGILLYFEAVWEVLGVVFSVFR